MSKKRKMVDHLCTDVWEIVNAFNVEDSKTSSVLKSIKTIYKAKVENIINEAAGKMAKECRLVGTIDLQGNDHLIMILVDRLKTLGYKIGEHDYPFSGETVKCPPHLHIMISKDRYPSSTCEYNEKLKVRFLDTNFFSYHMDNILVESTLLYSDDEEEKE